MAKVLDGKQLSVEDVVAVARHGETVQLAPEAEDAIRRCREMLERKVAAKEVMYGVNTGIGELAEVALDEDQTQQFQRYLIYNHAAGIGDPMPVEAVRGAMLWRVILQPKGCSA